MVKKKFIFGILLILTSTVSAQATPCQEALVQASLTTSSSHTEAIASLVSSSEWDQAQQQGGATFLLYDIPVGASYDAYHQAAETYLSQHNYNESDASDFAWTGLDPSSVGPYEACLQAYATSNPGPHLAVVLADQSNYTILVSWNEPGQLKTKAIWAPPNIFYGLPSTVVQGPHKYTVKRPTQDTNLSWNSAFGASETITLKPYQQPVVNDHCNPAAYPNGLISSVQTADFNSDGCPDNAAVIGSHMQTVVEIDFGYYQDKGPIPPVQLSMGDEGYFGFRWWVDLDGDGPRSYCRSVGNYPHFHMYCSKVDASGVEGVRDLGEIDMGYEGTGYWTESSGIIRYCRAVGAGPPNSQIMCSSTNGHTPLSGFSPP